MAAANDSTALGDDPDGDLIYRIGQGEREAFALLMDRHLATITALAEYMLGDRFAAEDVAQTVFLKTWQVIPKWEMGRAKLITWMRKVATNQCLDRIRRARLVYSDSLPDMEDQQPTPVEHILQQDKANRVKRAISNLPERQRAAISLSYYQYVSQKDGAEILGVSESAYESLLVRARKALKKTLSVSADKSVSLGAEL